MRVAMERVAALEDELTTAGNENNLLKAKISKLNAEQEDYNQQMSKVNGGPKLTNGSADEGDSTVSRMVELQETVDRMKNEAQTSSKQINELSHRYLLLFFFLKIHYQHNLYSNSELEAQMTATQKELRLAREQVTKLQHDLQEVRVVFACRLALYRIVLTVSSAEGGSGGENSDVGESIFDRSKGGDLHSGFER